MSGYIYSNFSCVTSACVLFYIHEKMCKIRWLYLCVYKTVRKWHFGSFDAIIAMLKLLQLLFSLSVIHSISIIVVCLLNRVCGCAFWNWEQLMIHFHHLSMAQYLVCFNLINVKGELSMCSKFNSLYWFRYSCELTHTDSFHSFDWVWRRRDRWKWVCWMYKGAHKFSMFSNY